MRGIAVLLLTALSTGCAAHVHRMADARTAFGRGDLEAANMLIAAEHDRGGPDADVLALDMAMVALADGRPDETERLLRRVRDRFDTLEEADAAETAWSALTDDTARGYAGEDHEKVLLRAMLALANLVQDGDDAEAYSLQVSEKQREIVLASRREDGSNPKAAYQQVALAPYLRGILREATHRHYDDAARHFAAVVDWRPEFRPGPTQHTRARGGIHSPRGHGVVHVFALVGDGPFKAEAVEMPSSMALAIAGGMLADGPGVAVPPTLAPVKVPQVVVTPSLVAAIDVAMGDWTAGRTETITDVSDMARRQQEAVRPETVARAVARRTAKKAAVFGTKRGLGLADGSLPAVAMDVAGVAWEASERADTRCWSLLPDTIQVLRLELPVGTHRLLLQPRDRQGLPVGAGVERTVTVADGRDTHVVVRANAAGIVGRAVTNNP